MIRIVLLTLKQGQVLMDVQAVRKSHLAAALGFQNVTLIFIEGGEAEQNIMKVLKGKKSFIFLRTKSLIMILVGFFHRT